MGAQLRPTQIKHRANNAKAKYLQKLVRDFFLTVDPTGGYESQPMGQPGTDIIDRKQRLPFYYMDCKHHEKYPSVQSLEEAMISKAPEGDWAAVLKLAGTKRAPVVIMGWASFQHLMTHYLARREDPSDSTEV